VDSPPCGGGLGWGVVPRGTEVPNLATPAPNPAPQGGGGNFVAPSRLNSAPVRIDPAGGCVCAARAFGH
jgi:hypothetical protein